MSDKTPLLIFLSMLGFWLALFGGRYLLGWLQVMRMRFGPGKLMPAARADMPEEVSAILDPVAAKLSKLGFEYAETFTVESTLRGAKFELTWRDAYFHPESGSWANVSASDAPEPGLAATVSFITHYPDRTLQTENRRLHLFLPVPSWCEMQDAEAASLDAHWAFHLRRLDGCREPVVRDRDIAYERNWHLLASLIVHWRDSGFMRPAGEDWRFTAKGAWSFLQQVMTGNRRMAALPSCAEPEDLHIRTLADLRAWRSNDAVQQSIAMSRRGKVLWFAGSALLGTVALGYMFTWEAVPVILGVLLFHEFGHALAMRALGYRGLSVLVLPFLGAVAIGRKDDAGPWQKLAVLLAGPLPGLLLSVVCLRLGMQEPQERDWLITVGAAAFGINLFNLLPFTPLDGGQMVETFLFARRPRLRFVFFAVSVAALVVIGLALDNKVLAGAGLVLALGLPAAWKRARLLRGVDAAAADPVAALFARFHAGDARCPPFAQRAQTVRALLPALRGRAPRRRESIAGLTAYVAAIAVPLGLLWDTGLPRQLAAHFTPAIFRPAAPDWRRDLAEAATPLARWQVLMEAGRGFESDDDSQQARLRYQEAMAELSGPDPDGKAELRRLDTRLALLRISNSDTDLAAYLELLPTLRALPPAERWRLAEVLEILPWLDAEASSGQRQAWLEEAIAVREADADRFDYPLTKDRITLARLYDVAGNAAGAEDLLRKNLSLLSAPDYPVDAWMVDQVAWFYIAHGRPAEVEEILAAQLSATKARRAAVQSPLSWVYLVQGKEEAARRLLVEQLATLEKDKNGPWQRWERAHVLIDLVHASAHAPEEESKWLQQAADLKAAMGKDFWGVGYGVLREARERAWGQQRGIARLAVLKRLPGGTDDLNEQKSTTCRNDENSEP